MAKRILILLYLVLTTSNTPRLIAVALEKKLIHIFLKHNPQSVAHGINMALAQSRDATAVAFLRVLLKMDAIYLSHGAGLLVIQTWITKLLIVLLPMST